jgi:DNA repair exonuclease SbcCD ATPase subunit/DNA repair exonuclease SbcCD nuclease subunit
MHKEYINTSAITRVDRILHIADVHIRTLKRHDEYRSVFEKLYSICREKVTENANTLIYLAGDIVHAKTDMTPELVSIVTEFLDTLSRIAPTVLIAGNHDCNLNNLNRMDALSPIVNLIDSDFNNLYYLKQTGVYTIHNIDFVLNSVYEQPENFILAKDVPGNNTKIVLFHGSVDMASTDIGTTMKNKYITIDTFDGYDYGMFGDIHKFQYLDPNSKFAYAGSLIQQNFGEGLTHGIIEWDIENDKSKFIKIHNDWTYHTIEIEDGKIKLLPSEFSKFNCIRLKVFNTSNADLFKIITKLKSNITVSDIKIQRISNKITAQTQITPVIKGDVRNVDHQNILIIDYIKNRFNVTDDILNTIKNINIETNKKIVDNDVVRNVIWEPIKFEFDNMFSYAENNKIQFDDMNGIYGLFAPNATGKSSILDALMFCIFDKCTRTFKAGQVLNNTKNEFKCKFSFKISGKEYAIERVGVKDKKGNVKVNVDFWTGDDDDKTFLNGDDRDSTNQIIRRYLGTYDDFILTAMSVQGNNANFIDKTQKDRKDLLAQFLDLNIFEELNALASDEIKGVQTLIKEFSKQDYSTKIADSNIKYKKYNMMLDGALDEKNKLQEEYDALNIEIVELNKGIINIDSNIELESIESLDNKSLTIKRKIQEKNDSLSLLDIELNEFQKEHDRYSELLKNFDKEDLKSKENELEKIRVTIRDLDSDLREINLQIQHCQSKLDNLSTHEYDPNCKFCNNNVFVKDAKRAEEKLKELIVEKTKTQDDLQKLNTEFSNGKRVYDKLNLMHKYENDTFVYQKKIYSTEREIFSINESIANLNKELNLIEISLNKYKENEQAIRTNTEIYRKLQQLELKRNEIKTINIKALETNILEYSGEVKIHEQIINECSLSIEKLQELEKRFYAYDYYLKAVNRNGVPYELISEALPKIQSEANSILSEIVDFQVLFDTDGKSINTYIVYDDERFWPLEMSSGMERFISSIAIRTAVINVSSLPRPNFMAIDEGLGTLDPSVLNNFSSFLDYLKTQFEFVILISHIDVVKDIVDYQIEIKKENGFSKIEM